MLGKVKGLIFAVVVVGILFIPLKVNAADYPNPPYSVPLEGIFAIPEGTNSYVEGNNVVVTDKKERQEGGIFSTEQIKMDLTKNFYSEMYLYIDGNADGMAFVMHNDPPKVKKLSGVEGQGLMIYAWKILDGEILYAMRNSFAIEFDTYHNHASEYDNDNGTDYKQHIAYTFPDKLSGYIIKYGYKKGVKHFGIQYPTFKLGDAKWRLLKIKWTTWNAKNIGNLTYSFGDLAPVSANISRDTFGTDSVYWGFTGSTGQEFEKAVVAFKSVPGLVNYTENLEVVNDEGDNVQKVTPDAETTVHYSGEYTGGKQNMLQPKIKFSLSKNQEYQEGTFLLNGEPVTPTYSINELELSLAKDLTVTDSLVDIQFKVKHINVIAETKVTVASHIAATNFISDKDASYLVDYDHDAPTGAGKVTFIDEGDIQALSDTADYSSFLSHYEDDFSSKSKIKIALKADQDIPSIVKTVGPSSFQVTLTDEKDNTSTVTIPIFIQDKNVDKSSQYIIYGKDFSFAAKDYPKTEEALHTLIREEADIKLWSYDESSIKSIDKNQLILLIDKLPKPSTLISGGVYEVAASYGSGALKFDKTFKVTLIPSFASVKLSFVDENNQPIIEDLSFEEAVYSHIDLSKNDQVLEKLQAIQALNYMLDTRPLDEKDLLIPPEGIARKYTFKGTLFIESAPNTIDFGDQRVSGSNKKYNDPNYDQHLVIWDNRSTLGTWKITLKQSQDFSIPGDQSQHLLNALSYQTPTEEKVISTDSQEVFRSKHQASGKYDISAETWGPKKQGLRLNVPVGSVKQVGKYETTLTWQIEDAY